MPFIFMRKSKVNRLMASMPKDWRYRWCEAGPCACMGCANVSGSLKSLGFTKKDWEKWKERQKDGS